MLSSPSRGRSLLTLSLAAILSVSAAFAQQAAKSVSSALASDYGKLPLSFEANQGQTDAQVKFLSRGQGYSLFLTNQGAVLSLSKDRLKALKGDGISRRVGAQISEGASAHEGKPAIEADVIQMQLVNANPHAQVEGVAQLPGTANYFIGNDPAKWRNNIPTYAKVQYKAVYPGITLVYYGNQRQLEYDFVVAPGANPKPIRLHFAGASKLRLNSAGDLTVAAKNGQIDFHRPEIYQQIGEQRRAVEGRFTLLAGSSVGFSLGSYDHAKQLVIDPVLVYSTYLGGSYGDWANAIAVDHSGSAYVAGATYSTDFPVTADAFQRRKPKTLDPYTTGVASAFVTKLNSLGTALVYSTYLGGSGGSGGDGDFANGIALDGEGNAYIVGATGSPNFPTTKGAFQTQNRAEGGGSTSAFVTKLNPTGTGLVYSTYLGGIGLVLGNGRSDSASGVAVDSSGNAYLAGTASSTDFPVTKGAFQTKNHGAGLTYNGFVTKINPTGTALEYSTYLGGSGLQETVYGYLVHEGDAAWSVALDGSGNAYIVGQAFSADFPVTEGALQLTNQAAASHLSNPFVSKLNPTGTELLYSTYLGGSGVVYPYAFGDSPYGLALDGSDNAYVVGFAFSDNFPVTTGAFQTAKPSQGANSSAFVAKLNMNSSTQVGTSTALTASANPAVEGAKVRITAKITDSVGREVTNGSVVFTVDGKLEPAEMLNASGTASTARAWLWDHIRFKPATQAPAPTTPQAAPASPRRSNCRLPPHPSSRPL